MVSEELEFSISQYLDGTLTAGEQAVLQARLAKDSEARALLDEHRRVHAALKSLPLPAVQWDALAAHISSQVHDGAAPVESYKMFATRPTRWLAAAAALVLAAGIAFQFVNKTQTIVVGPNIEVAARPFQINIQSVDANPTASSAPIVIAIGPSDRLAGDSGLGRYSDDIISKSSRVLIASSARPAQDSGAGPF